ncbi:MAG: CPBP family glutamic-type intramembrane protease [Candidatus Lokiarchaeota archaeon]
MNHRANKKGTDESKSKWHFCPRCGNVLPKIENLKYCTKCGLDLKEVKNSMELPLYTWVPHTLPYEFKREQEKITEDQIANQSYKTVWSTTKSIFLPILAFVVLSLFGIIIAFIVVFLNINLQTIQAFISSPFFFIISTFAEFIFLFFAIIFVGKYLKKPTFKNRFRLLGLTTEHYSKVDIVKEILLGIIFAIIGIFAVQITSISLELLVESLFKVSIQYAPSGIDFTVSQANIIEIIIIILMMFFVVGLSEETLFRGFQQKGLMHNLGATKGIIFGALIFSLIHIIGIFTDLVFSPFTFLIEFILSFFPYFVISLILAYLFYWRKQNLIAVIVTHGSYDSLTILLVFVSISIGFYYILTK